MDDSKTGLFAMSGLHTFRSRLGRLRFRRAVVRWQTAICRVLIYVVLALAVLLLVDFSLRLDTVPRAIVMLLAGCVLVWQAIRRIGPTLARRETVVDVALLLERTHRVDSDLVAALQFESSANGSAGSPELQQAVIDRAAMISETLDFRSAVPTEDARRAGWRATVALLSVAVCWLAFPNHASAFWNRLCLGDAQYPTRTRIDEVTINGRTDAARVVEGETVVFRVTCSGITPDEGFARLRGIETGDSTSVKLKRVERASEVAIYVADGPPMNEPMEVSIQIGDAKTEPRRIELMRRPIVELTIEANAPDYMRHPTIRQHEHYVQVMEGSSVTLSLRCTNGKRLKEARFELKEAGERPGARPRSATVSADKTGTTCQLDGTSAVWLTNVFQDLQFNVVVVDEDGLGTYHPIEGALRVKMDRAPTGTLTSLHHTVMPNANPTVTYAAEDDFGVGSMFLHYRRARMPVAFAQQPESFAVSLELPGSRGSAQRTNIRGELALPLSSLYLVAGDKVQAWLEVTDDRGRSFGTSTLSEVIELEVTDERGVLDAILRSDADAEQMLTDVIEKELGLRGER